jgi:hypothetical protein
MHHDADDPMSPGTKGPHRRGVDHLTLTDRDHVRQAQVDPALPGLAWQAIASAECAAL